MIIGALGDLFRIYKVAAGHKPDLSSDLKFRILSARPALKAVENTIARWCPDGLAPDDLQLVRFRSLVATELHSDPEDELLALLANSFRAEHPLTTVRTWMGELVAAAGSGDGYARVARKVWDDLIALRHARSVQKGLAIYAWTSADRPPDIVQKGRVLTGQQPQVHHLREGYFAPRTELSVAIADRVTAWVSAGHGGVNETLRLPLYWIGGRSGAGKSVMLLNVLALLHERGVAVVLFPSSVGQLPATVRWSRELHRPGGRPVVIALDDPYSPAAQVEASALWRDAIDELHEIRQAGDRSSMPLIVCCGPTEQAERLRDEMADDVAVTIDPLPHEGVSDFESLRNWYGERTGMSAPQVGNEDVLLVQLFFEWRVGETMPEFASRFRRRIRSTDPTGAVETALARILAVNRLYAGASRSAIESELSAPLVDVLDRLRQENHLADDPSPTRHGLWLAHPHLAETIYGAWFPATAANARREHIKDAILGSLNHGRTPAEQTAPIWALSRTLDASGFNADLARRIDAQTASRVLQEVHAWCTRSEKPLPASQLPVWIQVRRWLPPRSLNPDPLTDAIAKLKTAPAEEVGLRLTCHKLLEFLEFYTANERETAFCAITSLLSRLPTWREWASVAEDAIVRTRDERLVPLVAEWIEPRMRWEPAQRLLLLLLDTTRDDSRLTQIALEELAEADVTEEWSRIAARLIDAQEQPQQPVLEWIRSRRMEAGIAFVLGRAYLKSIEGSEQWCLEWAARFHLENNASRVLEPLCENAPSLQVVQWAMAWLEKHHEHSGYLMEKLVNATDAENDEVLSLALRWLDWTPVTDGEWPFVWSALWKKTASDTLALVGREWLEGAPREQGSWGFVWTNLWKRDPGNEVLAKLARDWLPSVSIRHGSWAFVLTDLWKFDHDGESLAKLAFDWLEQTPASQGSWHWVWEALWKYLSGDPRLDMLGRNWLANVPPENVRWRNIWELLWKQATDHEESDQLAQLAFDWLNEVPTDNGSWGFVWRELWKRSPSEGLSVLAQSWLLRSPPDQGSWGFVWVALWELNKGSEKLACTARDWLVKAPVEHGSWHYVWRELWAEAKGDTTLTTLAQTWLIDVSAEHGSWGHVWEALWKLTPNVSLSTLALGWLQRVSSEHHGWKAIWEFLWKRQPNDEALAICAFKWLATVPPEHTFWRSIWAVVWSTRPGDAALVTQAERWLADVSKGNPSWVFIWTELYKQRPNKQCANRSHLRSLGREWLLSVPYEHGAWGYVWGHVNKLEQKDQQFDSLGRAWLAQASPEQVSWKYVWEALWSRGDDNELATLGLKWLAATSKSHLSWIVIWEKLWIRDLGNGLLVSLAQLWLASIPEAHTRWRYIWGLLWKFKPGDKSLALLAQEWLAGVPASHGSWGYVWADLWVCTHASKHDLAMLAREWLMDAPPEHGSWPYVWCDVWKHLQGDRRLIEIAHDWIRKVPPHRSAKVRATVHRRPTDQSSYSRRPKPSITRRAE